MKKTVCILLILCLLLSLTACTAGTKNADAKKTDEPVILTVNIINRYDYLAFLSAFEAKYPNIRFEVSGFSGANGSEFSTNELVSGHQTDIYLTTRTEDKEAYLVENLIDLSAYGFVNNVSQSFLDSSSISGGIYCLPMRNTVYGWLYNKSYLDAWGMEPPQTYQDLAAIKERCDREGIVFAKINSRYPGYYFTWFNMIAKTQFLTTVEGLSWERTFLTGGDVDYSVWDGTLAYLKKLIDLGLFTEDAFSDDGETSRNDFYAGKCFFYLDQATVGPDAKATFGYDFAIMPFISEDGSRNLYWYLPSSFIGLSKTLQATGNEKKLEAALLLMDFWASEEGQSYLTGNADLLPTLKNSTVSTDSIVYDAYQASLGGRVVKQTYTTWLNLDLITPLGTAFRAWIAGEGSAAEVMTVMRQNREAAIATGGAKVYGEVTEDLTLEGAARIVGQIYGRMAGTDAVIMSLGETHTGTETTFTLASGEAYAYTGIATNKFGVNSVLYKGGFTQEDSWVPLPGKYGSIALLKLTGADIKEMLSAGFDLNGDGHPYPYVLVTKEGLSLEDGETYTVAMVPGGYSDAIGEKGQAEVIPVDDFLNIFTNTMASISPLSNATVWAD